MVELHRHPLPQLAQKFLDGPHLTYIVIVILKIKRHDIIENSSKHQPIKKGAKTIRMSLSISQRCSNIY